MIAQGSIAALRRQVAAEGLQEVELRAEPDDALLLETLKAIPGVFAVERQGEYILVRGRGTGDLCPQIAEQLIRRGFALFHLRGRGRDLDEIYRQYFQGSSDR